MSFKFAFNRDRASLLRRSIFIAFGTLSIGAGHAGPPAFPGAEGFGQFATGGRGGAVYHVTTLADSGPGSFRDAVSQPDRTVVFDVSGVIRLGSRVTVSPRVTLAGQTAGGEGITLYGNGVSFSGADNAIVRHLRVRMGIHGDSGKDAITIARGHDMIFDHVSVSWGRDETFSISGPVTNITIQNCIIGQGLQPHSAGGLIQTPGGVSILRTLYIDNHTRNPKVKGKNQFINNVIYNWGGGGGYILGDSESASFANVMNNYFVSGPGTSAAAFSRGNLNFHLYASGNFLDADRNGTLDGKEISRAACGTVDWQDAAFDYPPVAVHSAVDAWKIAVDNAGALPRDGVDQELIAELLSSGTRGAIIRSETELSTTAGKARAGEWEDTDRDGLPDLWEATLGLDSKNPADANRLAADGFSELEHYLNWLAAPHAATSTNQSVKLEPSRWLSVRVWRNPVYAIINAVHGSAALADGSFRFTPDAGFAGSASVRFSVQDADGSRFTNTVGVMVFRGPIRPSTAGIE